MSLVIDAAELQRLLTAPDGPVVRRMMVVGDMVKDRARAKAGVSQPAQRVTRGGGGQHLRDAIVKRMVPDTSGVAVHVIAEVPHARYHHDGTDPHVVEPVRAKALRFTMGGAVVFAVRVQHPGTAPNPFLTEAAAEVGLHVRRT